MKKITLIVSLSILLLTAVASTPYWVGLAIEKQLRAQSELLQHHPEFTFDVTRYQRGYLSSVVETRFTFEPQMMGLLPASDTAGGAPVNLLFRHQVSHGPLIDNRLSFATMSKVETVLVPVDGQHAAVSFYFNDQAPLSISSELEWSGEIRSEGVVPAYRGRDHTGGYDLKWGGLHFSVAGNWIEGRAKGRFNAPRLELGNALHGLSIGGLFGDFNRRLSPQGFPLGEGDVALNTFKLRGESAGGSPLNLFLRDLSITYSTLQRGVVIDVSQQIGFRSLQVNDALFKMGAFHLAFNNVDATVLQALQQRYANVDPLRKKGPAILMRELQPLLPKLLVQSPALDLSKIEVTTVDGLMRGRIKLSIDGKMGTPDRVAVPIDLMALLPLTQVEIDITLPVNMIERQARKAAHAKIIEQLLESEQSMTAEAVAKQTTRAAEQMLAQFEIQNIIRREADLFRTQLRYHDSHLYLNGVPADNFLKLLPSLKES